MFAEPTVDDFRDNISAHLNKARERLRTARYFCNGIWNDAKHSLRAAEFGTESVNEFQKEREEILTRALARVFEEE